MYAGTELNVISGATMKQWMRIVRKRDQMWRFLECTVCNVYSMYYVVCTYSVAKSPVHMRIAIMNPFAWAEQSVFGLMHKRYVPCLFWVHLRFGILDAPSCLGGFGVSSGQTSSLNGN